MNKLKKFYDRRLQKAIVILSLFCLFFSLKTVTASAQSAGKITATSYTVEKGTTASVVFSLEGNLGIWGLKLRIYYDHSALTLKSVDTGSVFSEDEIIVSENLSKDPFVVVASGNRLENKTANGTVITLNFTVNDNAELKSYPVTAEVTQANNVDGEKINIDVQKGSITVVNCTHSDKEWRVSEAAQCEKNGTEILTCKKCGETFESRNINATGHQHTEIRNAVAATEAAEGYTGDTYCQDCGKLISKGNRTEKIISDASYAGGDSYYAAADNIDTFENQSDDTVETGTTTKSSSKKSKTKTETSLPVPTESVEAATDTATEIVSETAVAQVTEKPKTDNSNTKTAKPIESKTEDNKSKSSAAPIIIVIVIIVLGAGGAVTFFVIRKRRW